MTGVIWAGGITLFLVFIGLIWIGLSAQGRPNLTGDEAMIGETGVVRRAAGFRNRIVVEVRGELWWSREKGEARLKPGDEIRVTGIDQNDLILTVEPAGRG